MNVFDMRGPDFLSFYLMLMIGAFFAATMLRELLRRPSGDPPMEMPPLDPFHWAYLSNGSDGAVNAALITLVKRGTLTVSDEQLTVAKPLDRTESVFEISVFNAVKKGHQKHRDVMRNLPQGLPGLADVLKAYQLIYPQGAFPPARFVPGLLMAAVLAIGGIKMQIGMSRDRPVAFLAIQMILAFILMLIAIRPVFRTRRGDRALEVARQEMDAMRLTALTNAESLAPMDLAMAMALFGGAMLVDQINPELRQVFYLSPKMTGGGSCGSGGCGGGGGGGGCGGCGGGD